MPKVHGSLTKTGRVKDMTPIVARKEGPKRLTGRAKIRKLYNRRFVTISQNTVGRAKRKLNPND